MGAVSLRVGQAALESLGPTAGCVGNGKQLPHDKQATESPPPGPSSSGVCLRCLRVCVCAYERVGTEGGMALPRRSQAEPERDGSGSIWATE